MAEKGKKILILGNGFDLAHGLPTRYSHFLEFCDFTEMIWNDGVDNGENNEESKGATAFDGWKTEESIKSAVVTAYKNRKIERKGERYKVTSDNLKLAEIHKLLDDNVWYQYFSKLYLQKRMKGENWIDFESEIRFIIKAVDENTTSLTNYWATVSRNVIDSLQDEKFQIFKDCIHFAKYMQRKKYPKGYIFTVKDFREKAFEDLARLTRVLEIYLAAFVENIPIEKIKKVPEIEDLNPDYVINFNYTNTYQRVYKKEVYHIHGKTKKDNSVENNNMVLGIDEYWEGDEKNEKTNFTIFKKFAQRIQKHTGNESYKYMEELQKLFKEKTEWSGDSDPKKDHPDGVSEVYVFGHSLDVTDKDILSGFIGDDATSVTVYCMDKGTEGELIANTIKLITEEKLLKKVNHVPTKLEYVIQKEQ